MAALNDVASVPTAAGRLPLIGHGLALARRKQDFLCDLSVHGELVRLYLGRLPVYYVHGPELLRRMLVTDARKVARAGCTTGSEPSSATGWSPRRARRTPCIAV
ncbi:hypothetical protein [Streptomyces jumonjinensis]|uniref:hypothetical protein n=1 Tax=Streptomyces jumonjinensis TaxID=1945 RepID=UPI0018865A53|nr:hypothetical protein [Streptomyces jumonjinensis]